jgi:hypothetical protein
MSLTRPRLQRRAGAGGQRPTRSMVKRWFERCSPTNAANPRVCAMVKVPTPDEEDRRHLCRERKTLTAERVRHVNRIKGFLFSEGVSGYLPLRRDRRSGWKNSKTGDGPHLPLAFYSHGKTAEARKQRWALLRCRDCGRACKTRCWRPTGGRLGNTSLAPSRFGKALASCRSLDFGSCPWGPRAKISHSSDIWPGLRNATTARPCELAPNSEISAGQLSWLAERSSFFRIVKKELPDGLCQGVPIMLLRPLDELSGSRRSLLAY